MGPLPRQEAGLLQPAVEPVMYEEMKLTPKESGFYMPPEWVEHECCWMGWPENPLAWRGRHDEAKKAIAELSAAIADFEPVRLLVPEKSRNEAAKLCSARIELVTMDIDDSWLRDSGPTFLLGPAKELGAVDWIFNGWGNMKYAEWQKDRFTAERICRRLDIPCFKPDLVTEGGALHVDGDGTVICTRPTLTDPQRNPGKNLEEIETILCDYLGAGKVLWLDKGFFEDETGGHIDLVASFTAPGRILVLDTGDRKDPNYPVFKKNIADLQGMSDAEGRALKVIPLPQPPAAFTGERRLDLSHENYYPANGAIILPGFGIDEDEEAETIFKREFPEREIVLFKNAQRLFHGGGGIHCLTQQQPKSR